MKTCDACEETWEDEFFCKQCSSDGELIEREVPDPMWDGFPGKDMMTVEEWEPNGNICFNCCYCHSV